MEPRRWGRLADRRAAALLASVAQEPAVVVAPPNGFPVALPPSPEAEDPPFASVVDATRPEDPGDLQGLVLQMAGLVRRGGTVALVTTGGAGAEARVNGPRTLAATHRALLDAGCEPIACVPFDLLGPLSPWRLGLGARRDAVLAELEEHLASASVRRFVRIVEATLTAGLAPEHAGRVVVVARRRGGVAAPGWPRWPVPRRPARLLLRLAHDDAVTRFLAFADAEWLSRIGPPADLVGWLRALADGADARADVSAFLVGRRRWWQPDLEVSRLAEAASHRMARRIVAELERAPGAFDGTVSLPETLAYDLIASLNDAIDRGLAGEPHG